MNVSIGPLFRFAGEVTTSAILVAAQMMVLLLFEVGMLVAKGVGAAGKEF